MPFYQNDYKWYFKHKGFYGIKAVGVLRDCFSKSSIEEKLQIIDVVCECLNIEETQFTAIRAAITIFRQYEGFNPIKYARQAVLKYPTHDIMRKTYANTLDSLFLRHAHLEAFKQRLIACMLDIKDSIQNPRKKTSPNEIFMMHFRRVDWIKDFLLGSKKYPAIHFSEHIKKRIIPDNETLHLLNILVSAIEKSKLPIIPERKTRITVVVDCNALSIVKISSNFIDQDIRYIIPTEVLFEFADWKRISEIPLELDAVEVLDVQGNNPPEVENMYSPTKRSTPSNTDKRVATLAFEQNADAIISADHDLYDSGFEGLVYQNYGKNIEVILPKYYQQWLLKKKETFLKV